MSATKPTICLCMIVKDEAPVIRRCIDSVRPLIDAWLIVDTGSTDGTQEIVREHLADLPGRLVERPWVHFAHNRSEAIAYARPTADFLFVIDADEIADFDEGFALPPLESDAYNATMVYGGFTYHRRSLVRSALPWRYQGVLHEYLTCDEPHGEAFLPGLRVIPHRDGARARDPDTYRKDALLLEQALIDDPTDARNVFYLAQSYRDAGDYELSVRNYRRRIEMGGWIEEVWYSQYQVGQLRELMGHPWAEAMQEYLAAHQLRPDRAGPLFRIGVHYQRAEQRHLARLFLDAAAKIPMPSQDRLFVERTLYTYAVAVEQAVAAHWSGDYAGAIEINNALARRDDLSAEIADLVVRNRRFSVDALAAPPAGEAAPAIAAAPPRATVVVPLLDPGPELDDCVEALIRQDHPERFDVVFADLGSGEDPSPRLPLERPHAALRRIAGDADAAVRAVAAELPGEEVVVVLDGLQRLTVPDGLERLTAPFGDPRSQLHYARHRQADGSLAPAEPAAGPDHHLAAGPALAGSSPFAIRAGLVQVTATAPVAGESLRTAVWRGAGLAGTRYGDDAASEEGD